MLLAQFIEPELSILQTALLTIWLFAIGACVGSFLNVVVYRTPAGLSIAHPPSHCPSCQQTIRRRDNIPIYSWLVLGGKCHYCSSPISIRYLLIELFVGLTFAILAVVEGTTNGYTLPGTAETFSSFSPTIWMIYGNHVILLSTLWCIALIDLDQPQVPRQIILPCLVIAGITMTIYPDFYPQGSGFSTGFDWRLNNLATAIMGAGIGALLGWALEATIQATRSSQVPGNGWILSAVLCGWVLGWQAIVLSLVITTALLIAGITTRELTGASLTVTTDQARPRYVTVQWLSPTCWLLLVTPAVIMTWKLWTDWFPS